jgi:hypothetical protein
LSASSTCSTSNATSAAYHVHRLIERYGIDAKLFDWEPEADCPRKVARNEHDQSGARCPDLAKAV